MKMCEPSRIYIPSVLHTHTGSVTEFCAVADGAAAVYAGPIWLQDNEGRKILRQDLTLQYL